ncbi:hypothetical protein ABIE48_005367 [Paenibacillus sp. OAE614]
MFPQLFHSVYIQEPMSSDDLYHSPPGSSIATHTPLGGWFAASATVHMRLISFESDENRTDHHDNAADLANEIIEVTRFGVLVHEPLWG